MNSHCGIAVQQKISLYDIWRKEGHAFSLNLFKEFMLLCMIESRFEEQYHDKCFAIYEDLKAAGLKPDMDVRILPIFSTPIRF